MSDDNGPAQPRQGRTALGVGIVTPPGAPKDVLQFVCGPGSVIGSAYSIFMEESIGSLKEGKFADLIVLSDDPTKVYSESLKDIQVLVTMIGGDIEYCGENYVSLCN